ncbi:MAG TPA: prepilin-type N-terminal cleavage/methylation domain-containing protein, partial [Gemmatimonadales bacterium]|nr:prepilin-type N-terminal cleavage/methylation domain-containing protein [Gemmatimonadales bacterium]
MEQFRAFPSTPRSMPARGTSHAPNSGKQGPKRIPFRAARGLARSLPEYERRVRMNRKGFTLIELLIVVVIIGILAAIAIPKFANTKAKAYIASMKSDLRNLVTAEEAFFAD